MDGPNKMSFNWAMFEVFRHEYLICFIVASIQIVVYILRPALMTMLIRYYEDKSSVDQNYGLTLVVLYCIV